MKKILLVFLGLIFSASIIAQTVTYNDASDPNIAKLNGVFHFNFDQSFPKEKLDQATTYYTDYFTIDYVKVANGHDATITVINPDPLARRVMERYFSVIGVRSIEANGVAFEVRPFLKKYVVLPEE